MMEYGVDMASSRSSRLSSAIWGILGVLFFGGLGFLIVWGILSSGIDRSVVPMLEKSGYSLLDIRGTDPNNCPTLWRSTFVRGMKGDCRVDVVVCTEVIGDSVVVRDLDVWGCR